MMSRVTDRRPSPPLGGMRRLYDVPVPMRDGIRLSIDLYLPPGAGPFPTILVRTPYDNGHDYYREQIRAFVADGYAFAIQDCRGRHDSEGTWYAWGSETEDGHDTQRWLAEQPWCAAIGTIGSSYDGCTQWLAAPDAHPALKAMVPAVCPSDLWLQDQYVGGGFALGLNLAWSFPYSGRGRRDFSADELRDLWWRLPLASAEAAAGLDVPWYRDWLAHPASDDYWRRVSNHGNWSRMTAPALNVAGWYDAYAGAAFLNYEGLVRDGPPELRRHQRIVMGPWHHHIATSREVGELDFGADAIIDLHALQRRYLDRHVRGIDDGLDGEAPVRIFVMGENRWREEWEWPLARTQWTDLFLGDDGSLADRPPESDRPDAYVYDPADPVITTGGNHSLVNPGITVGPVDQRGVEARADVISYTGPVLAAPLEVTGWVSAAIWFSSSAPDTDVTARLVDVHPDGRAINVCEGMLRTRYRESFERAVLLTPGEPAEIPIDLGVTSNVFLPGHRVRLDISSSNFPRVDRNLNTGGPIGFESEWRVAEQRVHHSGARPSRLRLPVIPTG